MQAVGLLLTFGLLIFNALLVASEFALVRARFSHFNAELLDRLREKPRQARYLDSADAAVRLIRFMQGICVLIYAVVFVPLLTQTFLTFLASDEGAIPGASILAVALAMLVAAGLFYVVGEAVPRAWGLTHTTRIVVASSWGWPVFRAIFRPLKAPFEGLSGLILRLTGLKDAVSLAHLDWEAQLEMAPDDSGELSPVAQLILRNAMGLRELVVSDVLLPRRDVLVFDLELPNAENLAMARETGHTRFPLCVGDLDQCVGLIHIKDLFRSGLNLNEVDFRKMRRDILRVEADEPLESALSKLLTHKMHMALVLDEFRGVQGVLTLERILEQLVGDIRDEFDADEELLIRPSEDDTSAENDKPSRIEVSGLTPLHEIERTLEVEIETDDVSTLSGLVTAELGRIPQAGETIHLPPLEVVITDADETRILNAIVQTESGEADDEK